MYSRFVSQSQWQEVPTRVLHRLFLVKEQMSYDDFEVQNTDG